MGFDPESFWAQSQATFGAAVRGRIAARTSAREMTMYGAWQTERFAREDRLKPFGQYLKAEGKAARAGPKIAATASRSQAMLAGLLAHRQAGAPMTVRRITPRG